MELIHSLILGIVEGVTEFLPISSTGHMILTSYLLGIQGEVVNAFEVFIQLGAILAVVVLYRHRFACLFDFKTPGGGFRGIQGWLMLAVTSLPILVLGKLLEHTIKSHLFNPLTVSWALALGGVVLIVIERLRFQQAITSLDELDVKSAFKIGLFQCAALCPGVSRAASTIIGGLFNGLPRTVAAEYSFLAAVPIMMIVCLKDLLEIWDKLSPHDLTAFGLGFGVAFVSALLAVKTFILMLQRTSMAPFGIYRIIVAIVFFWLLQNHPLS
ncbi:undecaprenyl-diphosphate phosphatase [Vampirovibrio chlorellavorus]|uniref:undecaprenyl-diphosphate phosphatase n=1 Tax=Vampirovibrio chlorellavorus TaxID=758823 RepID=UPI0026F2DCC8|nr:undecaprenyl-diphosphate phosphatase [Vampirovibrio chlorellavorus]